jgi:hypothetical protein
MPRAEALIVGHADELIYRREVSIKRSGFPSNFT